MRSSFPTVSAAVLGLTLSITGTSSAWVLELAAARYASSEGAGDYVYGHLNAQRSATGFFGTLTLTRPSGSSDWSSGSNNRKYLNGPGATYAPALTWGGQTIAASTLNNYFLSEAFGTWSCIDSMNDSDDTFTQNLSTSFYSGVDNFGYVELTSASATLFETIRANGLTGTFTFQLAQAAGVAFKAGVISAPLGSASGLPQVPGTVSATATSFQLTISQALATDALLALTASRTVSTGAPGDQMASIKFTSQSLYGSAVPAPGAIALLGLAGLAGRRRR